MFVVYDMDRVADGTPIFYLPYFHGKTGKFETLEEAIAYAKVWLGPMARDRLPKDWKGERFAYTPWGDHIYIVIKEE